MSDFQMDSATTALVLIDLQNGILAMPLKPYTGSEVLVAQLRSVGIGESTSAVAGAYQHTFWILCAVHGALLLTALRLSLRGPARGTAGAPTKPMEPTEAMEPPRAREYLVPVERSLAD